MSERRLVHVSMVPFVQLYTASCQAIGSVVPWIACKQLALITNT